eukprot:TRINITY_DN19824_c0_g2_i1.p1 TRINITY_DN19824_c0_g2~~TRINITY_DN19824_c0_g2_i1.p1  ORF type:complete len:143 (-),score=38.55 TRINITY_DN19824_c0_g2_i1:129-557(-)
MCIRDRTQSTWKNDIPIIKEGSLEVDFFYFTRMVSVVQLREIATQNKELLNQEDNREFNQLPELDFEEAKQNLDESENIEERSLETYKDKSDESFEDDHGPIQKSKNIYSKMPSDKINNDELDSEFDELPDLCLNKGRSSYL